MIAQIRIGALGKSCKFKQSKATGQCVSCVDEGQKQQRKEEQRLASIEARAKPAQRSQEDFEKSTAGRAARAQMAANAKQSANTNKGELVLKWSMG